MKIEDIKPTKDTCVLKYLEGTNYEETTKSGLILKDSRKVKLCYKAEVMAVGEEVTDVVKGDKVFFKWHQNEDFEIDNVKYTFVAYEKILTKFN